MFVWVETFFLGRLNIFKLNYGILYSYYTSMCFEIQSERWTTRKGATGKQKRSCVYVYALPHVRLNCNLLFQIISLFLMESDVFIFVVFLFPFPKTIFCLL